MFTAFFDTCCVCPANQDGPGRGWSRASARAAGAEDGGPEENLHQVDEQRLLQERGEIVRLFHVF